DDCVGPARLRAAVCAAGGRWLPDEPLARPVPIDGALRTCPLTEPRLLCAHYPNVFPAAERSGYRLVLAGHLHGGQCVLATVNDRLYPAAWFDRWHGLRFRDGSTTMLVSRGAG